MHYMLLFNETLAERGKRNDPTQAEAYRGGWTVYIGAIAQSGVMVSGNGLQPPDVSTTLRVENGKRHVVDGPFADTKEMLAGYVIVDVADLDGALEWASRAPCVTAGSVEIRPVLPPPSARWIARAAMLPFTSPRLAGPGKASYRGKSPNTAIRAGSTRRRLKPAD